MIAKKSLQFNKLTLYSGSWLTRLALQAVSLISRSVLNPRHLNYAHNCAHIRYWTLSWRTVIIDIMYFCFINIHSHDLSHDILCLAPHFITSQRFLMESLLFWKSFSSLPMKVQWDIVDLSKLSRVFTILLTINLYRVSSHAFFHCQIFALFRFAWW